jgi:hypothetical protein
MKTLKTILIFVFLFGMGSGAHAEVKQVRMKIAGYLCGN